MGLMNIQTCQQPGELGGVNFHDFGFGFGPFKTIFIQFFLPQAKSVVIPVQNFHDGLVAIAKSKESSGKWIAHAAMMGKQGKAVDGFTHVSSTESEKDVGWIQANHARFTTAST